MEDLKRIVADNIIAIRTNAKMTQSELAAQINYSDKSVSKWERAEAIPDVAVLKSIAEIFGVTIDYLVTTHENQPLPKKKFSRISHRMIVGVSVVGLWSLSLLSFIICWLSDYIYWQILVGTVPVSLIVLLVLNSIWGKAKHNVYIISALMLSILATIYLLFLQYNWWPIFLLAFPLEIVICLCFKIIKPKKQ